MLRKIFVCLMVVAAIVSTASASKESVQSKLDALKDTVIATGSVSSDQYSYVSVTTTAGENSEATIVAEGEGNWLDIMTSLYMETDNPVEGTGESYISADEVDAGSEANADSILNSIFLSNYAQGTGNAQGYACTYGWERLC